jgi:hypothetical protein
MSGLQTRRYLKEFHQFIPCASQVKTKRQSCVFSHQLFAEEKSLIIGFLTKERL